MNMLANPLTWIYGTGFVVLFVAAVLQGAVLLLRWGENDPKILKPIFHEP